MQEEQGLNVLGSELPGRGNTQIGAANEVPVVVDVETLVVEAADADAIAARVEAACANINVLEKTDATYIEEYRDEPACLSGVRYILGVGEELVLLTPVFVRRVIDRGLLDGEPARAGQIIFRERLFLIPTAGLRVEV